jgi:hypothetical protein
MVVTRPAYITIKLAFSLAHNDHYLLFIRWRRNNVLLDFVLDNITGGI